VALLPITVMVIACRGVRAYTLADIYFTDDEPYYFHGGLQE